MVFRSGAHNPFTQAQLRYLHALEARLSRLYYWKLPEGERRNEHFASVQPLRAQQMSTKIYNAFKLRDPGKLWPFLRRLRPRVEASAKTRLNQVADGLAADVKPEALEERMNSGSYHCEWEARESIVWDFLDKAYRKADRLMVRTQLDFTVVLSVREHKGEYYLIAHEGDGMRGVLTDVLERSRYVTDYYYQNSTDRPEEIPEDEWHERERTWSGIMGPHTEKWWDFLSLNIVCPSNWWRICPHIERLKNHLLTEPNSE